MEKLRTHNFKFEKTILVVDDEVAIGKIMEVHLSKIGCNVIHVTSPSEAKPFLLSKNIDLLLSDIAMPGGETGIDLLRWCREKNIQIPVVLISGFVTPDDVRYALSQGVEYVIHKPFTREHLIEVVIDSFKETDSYANMVESYIEQIELNQKLFMSAIDGFAAAIGARDGYTHTHSEQVSEFAVLLSREIGLDEKNIQTAKIAGKLHDIGKIGVPEKILLKDEKLSDSEYDVMKNHPAKAAQILGPLSTLASVIDGAKYHHERYDGTGYPDGLAGNTIPLIARILAVCDAFSAMITDRPYRPALSVPKAKKEILRNCSTQFDPELAKAFLNIPEIKQMQ